MHDAEPSRPIHVWFECHHCGATPIVGKRHHCETCPAGPDNDLCERCYGLYRRGQIRHPSEKSPAAAASAGLEHRFVELEGRPAAEVEGWLKVELLSVEAPSVPERFVVRPEFVAGRGSYLGGHGFVAELEGPPRPLLLTALHVMDELMKAAGVDATGANEAYDGRQLPAVVERVHLYDVYAENWIFAELGSAAPMLVVAGARVDDEEPYCQRDVAAFWVDDAPGLNPAPLAAGPPAVGEPVWLAVNAGGGRRAHEGVVVESSDRCLVFRFAGDASEPRYSSGAPVIDAEGRVVGINIGRGRVGGQTVGHAAHAGSVRRLLGPALESAP